MFCFCAASRRITRLLTARYDAALAPAGLTSAQFELLSVLHAIGPVHGRALADQLAIDVTTLSRNLRALLDAKLITQTRAKDDGRQILYVLSAAGAARLAKATRLWKLVHKETETIFGNAETKNRRALQRMSAALVS